MKRKYYYQDKDAVWHNQSLQALKTEAVQQVDWYLETLCLFDRTTRVLVWKTDSGNTNFKYVPLIVE
jgi:hypothetical protein